MNRSALPSPALHRIAEAVVDAMGRKAPSRASEVPLSDVIDRLAVERALRAAEAVFGPVVLGQAISGDGATSATWRLTGERGGLDFEVQVDHPDGLVIAARFVPEVMS